MRHVLIGWFVWASLCLSDTLCASTKERVRWDDCALRRGSWSHLSRCSTGIVPAAHGIQSRECLDYKIFFKLPQYDWSVAGGGFYHVVSGVLLLWLQTTSIKQVVVSGSSLQPASLWRTEQTKACITVREHLGQTVSHTALLGGCAKLYLFPPIWVYWRKAKLVFHFVGSPVSGHEQRKASRIPLFTLLKT